jgi:DNA recombination protein RmuC
VLAALTFMGQWQLRRELAQLRGLGEQDRLLLVSQLQTTFEKQSGESRDQLATRLTQTFEAMRQSLEGQLSNNRKELGEALGRIEGRVNERLETIGKNVQTKLDSNIQEGFKHFRLVSESLANAEKQLASLSQVGTSVNELNALLKLPHLRGGFGEATLERLLADFLPSGSYELQHKISADSIERVDAVVIFPEVKLPIDSKFPREQVLPLFESAAEPATLEAARKTLAEVIKSQAKSIADKYIKPEQGTTDLALMFLPSETLYFEVIRDSALWESLAKLKVFPVSPNTLSISLQFIGRSMHYYEASQNVKKVIADLGKARKHFDNFQKKFDDIGKGLEKAQDAFHVATRHLGTYKGSVNRLAGDTEEIDAPATTSVAALVDNTDKNQEPDF